jgi:two-component system response regulator AtoC
MRFILEGCASSFKHPDSKADISSMEASSAGWSANEQTSLADALGFVLILDAGVSSREFLSRTLQRAGYATAVAGNAGEAGSFLEDSRLDVVMLDLRLEGYGSGLDLLDPIKSAHPDVEVIMMAEDASIESAVGCIRRGAFDYLQKPLQDVHRIRITLAKALERRRLVCRNFELEGDLAGRALIPSLVGNSIAMRKLTRTIHSLQHNESHVLLQGESGTGKELVASAIHAFSPRSAGGFVPVDCGALPETIIESELFGHEKGAFTGAVGASGLFRMADSGTLFLDEIGEIPLPVQAKLLRALQNKEVRPVGAATAVSVNIRVISATHRDLAAMVDAGSFRTDLFYRLNVVRVEIPPLRDRREDIPLLVHHFLEKHGGENSRIDGIDERALGRLMTADWPGNVRQLENTIESAMALAPGPRLRAGDLSFGPSNSRSLALSTQSSVARSTPSTLPITLEAYERRALERALVESGGDATAAARMLGIGRSTFYRKLAKHSMDSGRPMGSPTQTTQGSEGPAAPESGLPRFEGKR